MPQPDQNPTRERDDDVKPVAKRVPAADVQPADAGTPASGNVSVPAAPVMKQHSKTEHERRGT